MGSKHTPGPWTYSTSNEGWTFDIYQAGNAPYTPESSDVATLYGRTVECDPKSVQEANARLMSASPELLAALIKLTENVIKAWPELIGLPPLIDAKRAIAKATGEQP